MDGMTSYEADVFAWAEEQGRVLRALAGRRDLPNALDLPNIAEEIESLGRSELRTVESFIRNILGHFAKAFSDPRSPALNHWRVEIETWQGDLQDALTPGMRQHIDMQRLWRRGVADATVAVMKAGGALGDDLPAECPFALEALTTGVLDLHAELARLGRLPG